MSQHKEQSGFVTFAINSDSVNYLDLAYLQALNIKATQKINSYAVMVDQKTFEQVTDQHQKVFDYVILAESGAIKYDSAYSYEPSVFNLTPFKETVKLEADLLFTRSIDHWWTAFRLRNMCLSTGARNYLGLSSMIRTYRTLFDDNELPDVYNGLMYFRYSQEAADFFRTARDIVTFWPTIRNQLRKCDEPNPSTDVLYALTALLIGQELCTMPSMDFLNFVHMKSGFNGWSDAQSWLETVMSERDGDIIRINNVNQYAPVHYYDKSYCTRELIKYYEQRLLA